MVVYLDYNATTPVDNMVSETISKTLVDVWANPSSSNPLGKEARRIIEEAREKVAISIGCRSYEIVFTSGGTESNNMVIHSAIEHFQSCHEVNGNKKMKPHIITSNIEHDSIKLHLEALSLANDVDVTFVPVSKSTGAVEVDDVIGAIRQNTCLITIMMANNETGVIQPIKLLGERLKLLSNRKCLFHTDAAQALGKIPVDVKDLGVDYLTIVGHKFYGPRNGALYFQKPLFSLFYGGCQETGNRPGTENTCMIAGLGKACELISMNLHLYQKQMTEVCNYFKSALKKEFSHKVIFNIDCSVAKLPNTLSVAFDFENLTGNYLLEMTKEICASTGAACHSGKTASSVLIDSGVPEHLALKTLRLSIGRETSTQDIDIAVKSLRNAVKKIKTKN